MRKKKIEKALKRANELSDKANEKIDDINDWLETLEELEKETVYRYIISQIGDGSLKRESKAMAMMQEVFRAFMFSHNFANNFVEQVLDD